MRISIKALALPLALAFFLTFCSPSCVLAAEAELAPHTIEEVVENIVADCNSTEEKAMAIYRYITRYFKYDYELCADVEAKRVTQYTPDPERTLNAGKGICYDLAVLYADMLQCAGIEVKLVKGYCGGVYHAWNSVYDPETDTWVQLDVTDDLWRGRRRREWREIDAEQYTVSSESLYVSC